MEGTVPQPSSPGRLCACCISGRRQWQELCLGLSPRERPAASLPPRSPWAIGERHRVGAGCFLTGRVCLQTGRIPSL